MAFLNPAPGKVAGSSVPPAKRTGDLGEDAAAAELVRRGWKILDRNWRSGHLELDIVARDHGTIVFVEVKTRAAGGMQRPYEALGLEKKRRLERAAQGWLDAHGAWDRPCRFDLACVTVRGGKYETELMQNVIGCGEGGDAVGGRNTAWQPW